MFGEQPRQSLKWSWNRPARRPFVRTLEAVSERATRAIPGPGIAREVRGAHLLRTLRLIQIPRVNVELFWIDGGALLQGNSDRTGSSILALHVAADQGVVHVISSAPGA